MGRIAPERTDITLDDEFFGRFDLSDEDYGAAMDLLDVHPNLDAVKLVFDNGYEAKIARAEKAFINVYVREQRYGGPEEGGWWFDAGYPVEELCEDVSHLQHDERVARFLEMQAEHEADQDMSRDYYSVNAGGIHEVRLEPHSGRPWPLGRPHYE